MEFRRIAISDWLKNRIFVNRYKYVPIGLQRVKNTHREKAPSNKIPTYSKIMNMDIWVVGTSNQLFIPGS